jgi:hypothetical protein
MLLIVSTYNFIIHFLVQNFFPRDDGWISEYFSMAAQRPSNKSDCVASEHRLKGNKLFQRKNFAAAKKAYDQVILFWFWIAFFNSQALCSVLNMLCEKLETANLPWDLPTGRLLSST